MHRHLEVGEYLFAAVGFNTVNGFRLDHGRASEFEGAKPAIAASSLAATTPSARRPRQ